MHNHLDQEDIAYLIIQANKLLSKYMKKDKVLLLHCGYDIFAALFLTLFYITSYIAKDTSPEYTFCDS